MERSRVVGIVSTYREGSLLEGAVASLANAVDEICIVPGPLEDSDHYPPDDLRSLEVIYGATVLPDRVYGEDKDKRNAGLRWAKANDADWLLWLDADEVLLWGEYLKDLLGRADHISAVGGLPLRIVELDGSVAFGNNRIINVHVVRKYLVAASTLELHSGAEVNLPNDKICGAGGMPWGQLPTRLEALPGGGIQRVPSEPGSLELEEFLARHRPPLQGEPHVLHRSLWRDPSRGIERQHEAEARAYERRMGRS